MFVEEVLIDPYLATVLTNRLISIAHLEFRRKDVDCWEEWFESLAYLILLHPSAFFSYIETGKRLCIKDFRCFN